jgi:DNA polymerase III epsilon subunit-like protein
LIRPATPIAALVTRRVHGISNADVARCPPWSAVAGEVAMLLAGRVLVAHNASVEHRVLGAHLPGWAPSAVVDTIRLAKHVWPGRPGGYGLSALIAHADLDPGTFARDGRHRASYDVWCTWQLLWRLVEEGGFTWDRVLAVAALPNARRPQEPEGLW